MSPAIALALLAALAAPDVTRVGPRFELRLAVEGARFADTTPASALAGQVAFEGTLYLRRLVEDDTPPALQPFLQRVGSLSLRTDFGRFLGSAARLATPFSWRGGTAGGVLLAADAYPHPTVPLHAELGASLGMGNDLQLAAVATAGLRVWNVRLDAGAALSPVRRGGGMFHAADLGTRFVFDARAVLLQRIDVRLGLQAAGTGAAFSFDLAYWTSPRLGLLVGIGGAHGLGPALATDEDLLSVRGGFALWLARRFALTALYLPSWSSTAQRGSLDNRLQLGFTARL